MKIQITFDRSQERGLVIEHSVLEISTKRKILALRYWTLGISGESSLMCSLKTLILRAADCNSTILVTGESGTGKELIARSVHDFGQRQGEPFLAINCGALTESLLESELFGHVKGAFTGATT